MNEVVHKHNGSLTKKMEQYFHVFNNYSYGLSSYGLSDDNSSYLDSQENQEKFKKSLQLRRFIILRIRPFYKQ